MCYYWHVLDGIYYPVEEYERSFEQNEELGLNDMDTSSADVAYESTNITNWVEERYLKEELLCLP